MKNTINIIEFKFRIWDKRNNKWFLEPRLEATLLNFPRVFSMVNFDNEIEQSTGLFDRNMKEIYDGDIVKSPDFDNAMIVEYKEIMPSDDMTAPGIGYQFNTYPEKMEIIGNIHENPELLKNI